MKKSFKTITRIIAAVLCMATMMAFLPACSEPETPEQNYDHLVKLTIDAGGQNA